MALPKAIQDQLDQADAIEKQLSGEAPVVQTDTQAQPQPADQSVTQPQVAITQEAPATPVVPEETWAVKFHTLKGKFDAEVPRLIHQVKEQTATMQALINENQALRAKQTQAPVVQKTPLITDADREAFGTDLVDMVHRAAKQETSAVSSVLEQLQRENEALKNQLGRVDQQVVVSAHDRFTSKLTQLVPDWEAVNQEHGWLVWLGAVDPVYGLQRQAGLDNAFKALNAERVAAIFAAYKASTGVKAPVVTPQQELQRQVAPSRSRNVAEPVTDSSATKIWSQQEISQFYADVRRHSYTNEQAAQIEQQIDAAVAEGRVR